jgi:hypothetical protein
MSEPIQPPAGPRFRQVALAATGFIATLILLFGLASLLQPSRDGTAVASPTATSRATIPVTSASPAEAVPSGSASGSPSGSPTVSRSGSPTGSIPSATPSGDPVLVGAGDIADCELPGDSTTAALIEGIPGTVFTAGDNAYPKGTADEFRDCYGPTWGRFLDRTRPSPGNHDWDTGGAAGYLGYFGTAAAPDGVTWYSYDLGSWHVVVLDSDCAQVKGCDPDSAQGRWLAADLAASSARCTLAIWHHPRFSSGTHGNDRSVAPFWQALYDAGADLVLNGHDHDYERFAPQDPSGNEDRERGLRQFVVGTGGAELRPFLVPKKNSELRVSVSHGVIRLTLHDGSYEWRFIPTAGDVGDIGSARCH